MRFNKYDQYGHLLEVEQENGIKKVYIWGYNNSMVVAEIDNISYSSIPSGLITAIQNASDIGSENSLLSALNNLRNNSALSKALVTTYTYIPLVGISSQTDPRGNKITYEYDSFNRLKAMKDHHGNILSEQQYNIKP